MSASSKSPFSAPASERVAYIDGGSRGNPGPSGYGVVIQDAQGRTIETLSKHLGKVTNNVAEYQALLAALEYAGRKQLQRLKIYCDSELVTKQMQGRYRVQSPDLKPLYERARELASRLDHFSIQHVPREQNREADRLVNEVLDRRESAPRLPVHSFSAVVEAGKLRPLSPMPELEEGTEYEIRARKRTHGGRQRK